MDSRLLEYFVAVAAEGGVSPAADRLYAAQSTVSAGLSSLERQLGVRLFERTTRSVRLTPAGERLLVEAQAALDRMESMRALAGQWGRGMAGRLTIGTFTAMDAVVGLPRVLSGFRRRFPHVDLRVVGSEGGSTGFARDLVGGRLDAAFFGLPAPGELDVVELVHSSYVALVPAGHDLAGRARVSLEELSAFEWIDLPAGFGSRVQLEQTLARQHLSHSCAVQVAAMPEVPHYVAAGLGVAVVPDILEMAGCVALPITDRLPPWTVSLATRRGASRRPIVAALIGAFTGTG